MLYAISTPARYCFSHYFIIFGFRCHRYFRHADYFAIISLLLSFHRFDEYCRFSRRQLPDADAAQSFHYARACLPPPLTDSRHSRHCAQPTLSQPFTPFTPHYAAYFSILSHIFSCRYAAHWPMPLSFH
jgi:hypothetical protein